MPRLALDGEVHNAEHHDWRFVVEGDADYALFTVEVVGDGELKPGASVVIPGYPNLVFRGTWTILVLLDAGRFIAVRGCLYNLIPKIDEAA